jgi:hypothetical protein
MSQIVLTRLCINPGQMGTGYRDRMQLDRPLNPGGKSVPRHRFRGGMKGSPNRDPRMIHQSTTPAMLCRNVRIREGVQANPLSKLHYICENTLT